MKPTKQQISKRIQEINLKGNPLDSEHISMDPNAIEHLCESLNGDLRQIFNYLGVKSRNLTSVPNLL